MAKKERLIELLQEKRTALITRAVTKGLDPNVPMKDSGVEWLGEIPAHWEVQALRRRRCCDTIGRRDRVPIRGCLAYRMLHGRRRRRGQNLVSMTARRTTIEAFECAYDE